MTVVVRKGLSIVADRMPVLGHMIVLDRNWPANRQRHRSCQQRLELKNPQNEHSPPLGASELASHLLSCWLILLQKCLSRKGCWSHKRPSLAQLCEIRHMQEVGQLVPRRLEDHRQARLVYPIVTFWCIC